MTKTHDELATIVGTQLLSNIRDEKEEWKQIFSTNIFRVGDWDWPRPDYVLSDDENGVTYANEFKPPKQTKREYLTGLGQCMAYLQKHDYAGLMLPKYSDDGFKISEYVFKLLSSEEFCHLPISLIEYDENSIEIDPSSSVKILKSINEVRGSNPINKSVSTVVKTFWCFWRDASHYEIYDLLKLADKYNDEEGDIYSNFVYPEFYHMLVSGNTKQWDGTGRKKKKSEKSRKSEKQNYKIPLFHLGLWSQSEGRLTAKGYRLLTIGKLYGANSKQFKDYLTYLLLIDGKHLQLIHEFVKFQNESIAIESKSKEFLLQVEEYFESKGHIGKRKPTAKTTNAKVTYLRDEPKVWNHLGLVLTKNKAYFFPNEGFKFKWDKITEILTNDYNYL
ncbi:hypothetical protein PNU17_12315 [Turicibacter sanguinis]|uniref:hypothetical protein n=1 Tax=Turicibacter sanguinis TaxID=154288 RepID=UPI00189B5486|nr:hypothetical protein [Turicibacter sanguinis]MDB8556552.1 hypothetical protein [Turicibacter sanguinis]